MRRALSMLLAIVAMLVPAASAIAAPMRDAARVELGAENRVKAISPSGVVEAEGHTLFLQRDPNGYQDSVNQYAYGANDPINHRDPTGRRVALGTLGDRDRFDLLVSLRTITGLDLDICSLNDAYVSSCVPGDLIDRGSAAETFTSGSSIGRDILLDAIEDPDVVRVEAHNGSTVAFGSHPVTIEHPGATGPRSRTGFNFADSTAQLDFLDHARRRGPADVLAADSIGFTFLHELLHAVVKGSRRDPRVTGGFQYLTLDDPDKKTDSQPGEVETIVNRVRDQLHLPSRAQYQVESGKEGETCVLFSTGRMCFDDHLIFEQVAK